MQPFTVHWSPVSIAEEAVILFALWPSPVNLDACFIKAGFTDFGDADESWENNSDGLLTRLLGVLSSYGVPQLMSKPIERRQSWYRRLFTKAEFLDLRQQIELPLDWDSLPDCIVRFGETGVSLRTGSGHHIFWVTLPHSEASSFPSLVGQVAASHPIARTELRWEYLV
jgi:hypothetical protein